MDQTYLMFQIIDLSVGFDYNYSKYVFGMNMTYQSESYGTATETETEEFGGSANARAGRIDITLLETFMLDMS